MFFRNCPEPGNHDNDWYSTSRFTGRYPGDWCLRSDSGASWILTATPQTVFANWVQLTYAPVSVVSVAGRTGVITLTSSDIGGLAASATTDTTNATNITSGTLNNARLPAALTSHTYDGLTNTSLAVGYTIAGGTTSKTLTVDNNITIAGIDGSTVATLDQSTGKLNLTQMPEIAIVSFLGTVSSPVTMTTIGVPPAGLPAATTGDWCIRSDLGTSWILTGTDQTVFANWLQLSYPPVPVTSVAGRTGTITLSASDISGLASSATTDTTNASNITSGLLGVAYGGTDISTVPVNGALLIGNGTNYTSATITQNSANQVIVTNGAGTITLSTPQDINTSSNVTFNQVTVTDSASGALTVNGTNGTIQITGTNGQLSFGGSNATITGAGIGRNMLDQNCEIQIFDTTGSTQETATITYNSYGSATVQYNDSSVTNWDTLCVVYHSLYPSCGISFNPTYPISYFAIRLLPGWAPYSVDLITIGFATKGFTDVIQSVLTTPGASDALNLAYDTSTSGTKRAITSQFQSGVYTVYKGTSVSGTRTGINPTVSVQSQGDMLITYINNTTYALTLLWYDSSLNLQSTGTYVMSEGTVRNNNFLSNRLYPVIAPNYRGTISGTAVNFQILSSREVASFGGFPALPSSAINFFY